MSIKPNATKRNYLSLNPTAIILSLRILEAVA